MGGRGFGGRGGGRFRADVENARKIKGLGPGIVEKFDTMAETGKIKASEKVTNVLNAKFLILVLILVVISVVFYMLKDSNSI